MKKQKKSKKSVKHDQGKPKLNLVSTIANWRAAEVMTDGEATYGSHNWRETGFDWSRLIASTLRHIEMFKDGMDKDPKSGRSNLAHARCCIDMLLEHEELHKDKDDRHKIPLEVLKKLYS